MSVCRQRPHLSRSRELRWHLPNGTNGARSRCPPRRGDGSRSARRGTGDPLRAVHRAPERRCPTIASDRAPASDRRVCARSERVRDLDQRFSESDLRGDPIGVLGTGTVLGRRSEQTHGVARHHPVPTRAIIQSPPGVALKFRWSTSMSTGPMGRPMPTSSTAMSRRRRHKCWATSGEVMNIS